MYLKTVQGLVRNRFLSETEALSYWMKMPSSWLHPFPANSFSGVMSSSPSTTTEITRRGGAVSKKQQKCSHEITRHGKTSWVRISIENSYTACAIFKVLLKTLKSKNRWFFFKSRCWEVPGAEVSRRLSGPAYWHTRMQVCKGEAYCSVIRRICHVRYRNTGQHVDCQEDFVFLGICVINFSGS